VSKHPKRLKLVYLKEIHENRYCIWILIQKWFHLIKLCVKLKYLFAVISCFNLYLNSILPPGQQIVESKVAPAWHQDEKGHDEASDMLQYRNSRAPASSRRNIEAGHGLGAEPKGMKHIFDQTTYQILLEAKSWPSTCFKSLTWSTSFHAQLFGGEIVLVTLGTSVHEIFTLVGRRIEKPAL